MKTKFKKSFEVLLLCLTVATTCVGLTLSMMVDSSSQSPTNLILFGMSVWCYLGSFSLGLIYVIIKNYVNNI